MDQQLGNGHDNETNRRIDERLPGARDIIGIAIGGYESESGNDYHYHGNGSADKTDERYRSVEKFVDY